MKKVEKFRLNKDQVGFMKEMGRLNKVKQMLSNGPLKKWYAEGNMLKRLFGQLNEKQQMLQVNAPSEVIEEIPGQEGEPETEMFEEQTPMGQQSPMGQQGQGQGMPDQAMVR